MGCCKFVGKFVSNEGVEEKRQVGFGSCICFFCIVYVCDILIGQQFVDDDGYVGSIFVVVVVDDICNYNMGGVVYDDEDFCGQLEEGCVKVGLWQGQEGCLVMYCLYCCLIQIVKEVKCKKIFYYLDVGMGYVCVLFCCYYLVDVWYWF